MKIRSTTLDRLDGLWHSSSGGGPIDRACPASVLRKVCSATTAQRTSPPEAGQAKNARQLLLVQHTLTSRGDRC